MKKIICALLMVLCFAVVGCTQTTKLNLTWTASGDDGTTGTATSYYFEYSADSTFNTFTEIPNPPTPSIAGTTELFVATISVESETTYYFRMITCDEKNNCSDWSNVVSRYIPDIIPPSITIDLSIQ